VTRREFITLLGGAAAWPLAARAQQAGKLPTVGFLGAGTPATYSQWVAAFVERLHGLGWIEGRTVTIEVRWAEGRSERYSEIAAEFARLSVDVIVTSGIAARAAKQVTSLIPIVFALTQDPVGIGLVASLASPGGNATGLSTQQTDAAGKRLELLRELLPDLRRLAILINPSNVGSVLEMGEVKAAARVFGLDATTFEVRRAEDIGPVFAAVEGHADAMYACADPLIFTNRTRIGSLALGVRLPTMHDFRDYVEAGGLISYGANIPDLWRRAADFVDKILRGTKPADLPVEQPTKFDLVVNLATAKGLGLTIPESFLLRADEVIE
jgi:putative ABC transport system substrate-binding protein